MNMNAIPTGANLSTFLAAFGKEEDVRREVEQYWAQPGASPYPVEIFNHLMDARRDAGKITPKRAEFLKSYFAESFDSEPTTGYINKHREPLIREFVDWYVEKFENPVFRIEADIMNLGGLNRDLTGRDPKYKHLADSVIRLMSNIVREHLERFGDVCAIRSGGDELGLFLRATKPDTDVTKVNAALNNAQHEIAEFIHSARLTDVVHTKEEKMPGVGIGCSAILLEPGKNRTQQNAQLEADIVQAKDHFQNEFLGVLSTAPMEPADIIELFQQEKYNRHLYPRIAAASVLRDQKEYRGANPEAARIGRLERHMASLDPKAISPEERGLLEATSALTLKRDHVTGLPWFRDMKRDLIPNFLARFGDESGKITLVHFDFNNLGGGNALGSWVGDAMAKQFAASIQEALAEFKEGPKGKMGMKPQMGQSGQLGQYLPYLTAQGGGKFALLLPAGMDRTALLRLQSTVEVKLAKRLNEPLALTVDELDQSKKRMLEQPLSYPNAKEMTAITIGDICNAKDPSLKGAQVMASFTEIDGKTPHLGGAITKLEETVKCELAKRDKVVRERGRMVQAYVAADDGKSGANWRQRTEATVTQGTVQSR